MHMQLILLLTHFCFFYVSSIPWIPYEYHHSLENARLDFKAEVWAYATTLWEIFSRGRAPTFKEVCVFLVQSTILPFQLTFNYKSMCDFSL